MHCIFVYIFVIHVYISDSLYASCSLTEEDDVLSFIFQHFVYLFFYCVPNVLVNDLPMLISARSSCTLNQRCIPNKIILMCFFLQFLFYFNIIFLSTC